MADFALDTDLAPESEAVVLQMWYALAEAGLLSQADNARGMVNEPHLCFAVAQTIPQDAVRLASARIVPLLPVELAVRGLLVIGEGSRVTLALLAEPPAALADAVLEVRRAVPALRYPVWTPHITLARRLPRAEVGRALGVLEAARPRTLMTGHLRWWDPAVGRPEPLG